MFVSDLAARLQTVFDKREEIIAAFVFGSLARGTEGTLSDVDIAVLLDEAVQTEESGFSYAADLAADLIKALHRNDVDVVLLNTSPPLLKDQVLRSGRILFCRSAIRLSEFRLKAFNEFQDWLPFLSVQQQYISKRLETGEFGKRGR